jgi:hypothetical protein
MTYRSLPKIYRYIYSMKNYFTSQAPCLPSDRLKDDRGFNKPLMPPLGGIIGQALTLAAKLLSSIDI